MRMGRALGMIAAGVALASPLQASNPATPLGRVARSTADSLALAVAETVRTRMHLPEQTLVAHSDGRGHATTVWKVQGDSLVAGRISEYQVATGRNRKRWRQVVSFVVGRRDARAALVEVVDLYARGLIATSRGGYAEEWKFGRRGAHWVFMSSRVLQNWD